MVKILKSNLITLLEAGKILGMTKMGVWKIVQSGKLQAQRCGKDYVLDKANVLALKAFRERKGGMAMPKKTMTVTKTYEMENIECPECKDLFCLRSDLVKEKIENDEDVLCPYCGEKFTLEDDEDDEDGEEEEEEEEE